MLGGGYNCKYNITHTYKPPKKLKNSKGEDLDVTLDTAGEATDGIWNKVSAHVTWIRKQAEKLGEKLEECGVPKVDGKLTFGGDGDGSGDGDSGEKTTTETESKESTTESGDESTTEKESGKESTTESGGLSAFDETDEPDSAEPDSAEPDSTEPVAVGFRLEKSSEECSDYENCKDSKKKILDIIHGTTEESTTTTTTTTTTEESTTTTTTTTEESTTTTTTTTTTKESTSKESSNKSCIDSTDDTSEESCEDGSDSSDSSNDSDGSDSSDGYGSGEPNDCEYDSYEYCDDYGTQSKKSKKPGLYFSSFEDA